MKSDKELEKRLLAEYKIDFKLFAYHCLKIRTKNDGVVPFKLNSVQLDLLDKFYEQMQVKGRVRFIVLKARQMGLSTFIEALLYWWTIYHRGVKSLVLTHKDSATKELFEMTTGSTIDGVTVVHPDNIGKGIKWDEVAKKYVVNVKAGSGIVINDDGELEVKFSNDPSNLVRIKDDGVYYGSNPDKTELYVDAVNGNDTTGTGDIRVNHELRFDRLVGYTPTPHHQARLWQ